jgi:hypothetical protein
MAFKAFLVAVTLFPGLALVQFCGTGFAADKEERWLASTNGLDDLSSLTQPNVAIGIPGNEARAYIHRLLNIEKPGLLLVTMEPDIALDRQVISADSFYRVTIGKSDTGFAKDIAVEGTVAFHVGIAFSGHDFKFFPRVEKATIDGVFESGSSTPFPLPTPIDVELPEWLHDAIIETLAAQGRLQLPVSLSRQIALAATPATQAPDGPAVTLSQEIFGAEYWVTAASTLIDASGIVGAAQINFDLSLANCSKLVEEPPKILSAFFTLRDSRKPIGSIDDGIHSVVYRGEVARPDVDLELYFRLNGISVSVHGVGITSDGHGRHFFNVPLAILSASSGVYSASLTAKVRVPPQTQDRQCIVASDDIIRLHTVNVTLPDPLSKQQANEKFVEFATAFRNTVSASPVAFHPGKFYLSIAKSTLASAISKVFSGIGLRGTIDFTPVPTISINGAKIKLPKNVKGIVCTPTRECEPKRDCTLPNKCKFHEDRRNCRRSSIFGDYNDPFCEAAKAAENIRRRASYWKCEGEEALWKLDCERIKTTEKATCELEKSTEKALCETIKGGIKVALPVLAPDGNLATINGDFKLSDGLRFEIIRLDVDPTFSAFDLDMNLGVNLGLRAGIEFVPNNLIGHLTCISKWKETVRMRVRSPANLRKFSSQIDIDSQSSEAILAIATPELPIKFDPPPITTLFADHPHLVAVCPLLFAAGVADGIYDLLSPDYKSTLWTGDYEVAAQDIDYKVGLPTIEIAPNSGFPPPVLLMIDDGTAFTWQ